MQMAKSLVMKPASMVSMQTASSDSANTRSSVFSSSFARWRRPRVHAKMEAVGNRVQSINLMHTCFTSLYNLAMCWCWRRCIRVPTNGISGGFFSLLVLSEVACYCAVGSLRLHRPSIRADQNTSHHTQRAITWNTDHMNESRKPGGDNISHILNFTNLVRQSLIVHLRHSSCTPKWILPLISWPGPPCRLSDGAHTRCLWLQTEDGIPWNTQKEH